MSNPTTINPAPNPDQSGGGRRRWIKWAVIGVIAAVVLFFGAIFLYAKVINDSPDEFSAGDIDAALEDAASATTLVETGAPPVASAPDNTEPVVTNPTATGAPAADTTVAAPAADGSMWNATDASQVGYRIEEILFGVDTTAVGRTNQVTGTLTIDGSTVTTTNFEVDTASITSDESRRDNQFRRIMSVDEFPTATFVLTQPIEIGQEPADGVELTAAATGDLTLRGVTLPVTFELTAKQDSGLIGVQGAIPVVFADYGIANPSTGGITTEDNGLLEFVLVFQPA